MFTHPENFDPDRFDEERKEDKRMPFAFIAFGGGRHQCMGGTFAFMQIKTVLSILIRRFEFELVGDLPQADFTSMVVGPKPVALRYRKRKVEIGA